MELGCAALVTSFRELFGTFRACCRHRNVRPQEWPLDPIMETCSPQVFTHGASGPKDDGSVRGECSAFGYVGFNTIPNRLADRGI